MIINLLVQRIWRNLKIVLFVKRAKFVEPFIQIQYKIGFALTDNLLKD